MNNRIHILKRWPCGGGMQTVVNRHIERGDPIIAATGKTSPGVVSLNLSPNQSLSHARRALAAAAQSFQGQLELLHYNGYAVDWFPGNQRIGRHLICLHSDYPMRSKWLDHLLPFSQGGYAVNEALADWINRRYSLMADKLIHPLVLPLEAPRETIPHRDKPEPIVIGYAGRVERHQKRLDRLPVLIDALDRLELDYRIEILGDGSYLRVLQDRLSGNRNVRFHGHLDGSAYWQVMKNWKYMLFLSDYEGLPIALLEGLLCGAIPVYPDFYKGEDVLAKWGHPFLYHAGDTRAAALAVYQCEREWPADKRDAFFAYARGELLQHDLHAYFDSFEQVSASGGSDDPGPRAAALPGWLPLWVYHRVQKGRQHGCLSLITGN